MASIAPGVSNTILSHGSVGPASFPAVEIDLRLFQALEAQSLERRLLGVADAGFDLALAIGSCMRQGMATAP
jgi:hypothetical protein